MEIGDKHGVGTRTLWMVADAVLKLTVDHRLSRAWVVMNRKLAQPGKLASFASPGLQLWGPVKVPHKNRTALYRCQNRTLYYAPGLLAFEEVKSTLLLWESCSVPEECGCLRGGPKR